MDAWIGNHLPIVCPSEGQNASDLAREFVQRFMSPISGEPLTH